MITRESTSRTASVGDVCLQYHEAGDPARDAVVMLHGAGPGASGWFNFQHNIAALAQHFHVLVVDQLGYGGSDKPHVDGTIDRRNMEAVVGLLDHLGIERAHLVGNSLGGVTSLMVAVDHPERVARLVLMGSGGFISVLAPQPTEGNTVSAAFYADPGPTKEKMRALFDVMLYDHSLLTEEILEHRWQAALEPEHRAFFAAYIAHHRQLLVEGNIGRLANVWQELPNVSHETMIVWGRDDRTLPLDGGLFMLRQLPNARLVVFGRCGHWAQWEKADEFNRIVAGFLGEGAGDEAAEREARGVST